MQNESRKVGYYGAYGDVRANQSTAALTEDMVHTLAQKYDVTHMSRNEYSLLLYDLRSAGIITTQEFSAGYGGTLPRASIPVAKSSEALPFGDKKVDFAALLKQYVDYCGEYLKVSAGSSLEQEHLRSLLSTYSHLDILFRQIRCTRLESFAERGSQN